MYLKYHLSSPAWTLDVTSSGLPASHSTAEGLCPSPVHNFSVASHLNRSRMIAAGPRTPPPSPRLPRLLPHAAAATLPPLLLLQAPDVLLLRPSFSPFPLPGSRSLEASEQFPLSSPSSLGLNSPFSVRPKSTRSRDKKRQVQISSQLTGGHCVSTHGVPGSRGARVPTILRRTPGVQPRGVALPALRRSLAAWSGTGW